MPLAISCAFPPTRETPQLVAVAEELGYDRAWCYDSPAVFGDVWMTLALAARETSRIGLGPAVLIPSLRHPAVTAAALLTLAELAPGRVAAALGTGFSGRFALGQRRLTWAAVSAYATAVSTLLRGDRTTWEGTPIQLLDRRPSPVPLLIGADGPKGREIASRYAQGLFTALPSGLDAPDLPAWRATPVFGTVLDEGEDLESAHVWEAAAPHLAVALHAMFEEGNTAMLDAIPGGAEWRAAMEAIPSEERHLALHEGHLVRVTDRDTAVVRANLGLLSMLTLTGTRAQVAERAEMLEQAGVTEVVYQPTGPDAAAELERFVAAVRG